jgi:hypothetical protein
MWSKKRHSVAPKALSKVSQESVATVSVPVQVSHMKGDAYSERYIDLDLRKYQVNPQSHIHTHTHKAPSHTARSKRP